MCLPIQPDWCEFQWEVSVKALELSKCWTNMVAWKEFVESHPPAKLMPSYVLEGPGSREEEGTFQISLSKALPKSRCCQCLQEFICHRPPKGGQCVLVYTSGKSDVIATKYWCPQDSQFTGLESTQRWPDSSGVQLLQDQPEAGRRDALFSPPAYNGNLH